MTIKLLAVGKTDNASLQALIAEYQKRLKHYVRFELELIPDIKNVKNLSESRKNKPFENDIFPSNDTIVHS